MFNPTVSSNIGLQENRFKVINRWYLTPERLAWMCPQLEAKCWCCQMVIADFLHVWWKCSKLEDFWKQIKNVIE